MISGTAGRLPDHSPRRAPAQCPAAIGAVRHRRANPRRVRGRAASRAPAAAPAGQAAGPRRPVPPRGERGRGGGNQGCGALPAGWRLTAARPLPRSGLSGGLRRSFAHRRLSDNSEMCLISILHRRLTGEYAGHYTAARARICHCPVPLDIVLRRGGRGAGARGAPSPPVLASVRAVRSWCWWGQSGGTRDESCRGMLRWAVSGNRNTSRDSARTAPARHAHFRRGTASRPGGSA
jgi:hypothetical protein